MNNDLPLVHGISRCMVCIPMNNDRRAAHEHCQLTTRNSVDRERNSLTPDPITHESLPENIIYQDLLCPCCNCRTDLLVEGCVMEIFCINPDRGCHYAPTVFTSRTFKSPSSSMYPRSRSRFPRRLSILLIPAAPISSAISRVQP